MRARHVGRDRCKEQDEAKGMMKAGQEVPLRTKSLRRISIGTAPINQSVVQGKVYPAIPAREKPIFGIVSNSIFVESVAGM